MAHIQTGPIYTTEQQRVEILNKLNIFYLEYPFVIELVIYWCLIPTLAEFQLNHGMSIEMNSTVYYYEGGKK